MGRTGLPRVSGPVVLGFYSSEGRLLGLQNLRKISSGPESVVGSPRGSEGTKRTVVRVGRCRVVKSFHDHQSFKVEGLGRSVFVEGPGCPGQ